MNSDLPARTAAAAGSLPSATRSACSYWWPRHFITSAWIGHAPFAAWLMDAIRPQTAVELGTHTGYSFFAFAEAAKRLGIDTRLVAVDSWEGDDHAGFYGEEVYATVAAIAATDYPDITELRRGYFADMASTFADGSIDLLHVDGRHGYEDVKADYECYLPKLSSRAVVIFHDAFEFQEGFGVHRYWDELANTRPSFLFQHEHGLGVLAAGKDIPPRLTAFLDDASADPERVRAEYVELAAVLQEYWATKTTTESRLAELEPEVARLRVKEAELERRRDEMLASSSWRITAPLRTITRALRPRG